jgi:DNA-binding NarL/FixJ family response regulator
VAETVIRVFLLDDHEVVRRGVRDLLETHADMYVCGEAGTAAEAVGRILATSPDVALLDVSLPDGDGVSVCREVLSRRPNLKVLMLTSLADDEALFDAIMAGAAGYVLKQVRSTELVEDIRRVASGQSLLDPALTAAVLDRVRRTPDPDGGDEVPLTQQEQQILDLLAEGRTNRQIGEALYLAEKTVKNYVSALLHKLGMKHRTEAAVYAVHRQEAHVPSYARHAP